MNLPRVFAFVLLLCISSTAAAQDWYFLPTDAAGADWDTGVNWDVGSVPGAASNAFVGDDLFTPATANITADLSEPTILDLRIGFGNTFGGGAVGVVNHSAGTLTNAPGAELGWAFVGVDGPTANPNMGTYNLSGTATYNNDSQLHVGYGDTADFSGNQGAVHISENATANLAGVFIGSNNASTGELTITGNAMATMGDLAVGQFDGSTGELSIGDDAMVGINQLFVGRIGSTGTATISGNAVVNIDQGFVGKESGGMGTVTQTGGTVNVTNWLAIGETSGATGTYNISAGSLIQNSDFLSIGQDDGASGTMNVSGTGSVSAANTSIGRGGTGVPGSEVMGLLTIDGPDASFSTDVLRVGRSDDNGIVDAIGTISFSSSGAVTPIEVATAVYLNDGSAAGSANLEVDLSGNRSFGDNILLISVGEGGIVDGTFSGLPEGAMVPGTGRTITYMGGDGNDIVLLSGGVLPCDFDGSGSCDIDDIDELTMAVAMMSGDLTFDLNNDNMVDEGDIAEWLVQAGADPANVGATSGNPFLAGDFDLNGFVDGQDFIVWNGNKFTTTGKWSMGDANGDGLTDGQDFVIWNGNKFQSSSGSDVAAVPEPSAALLGFLAMLAVAACRRSSAQR